MAYKDDDEEWYDDEHETLADRKYADSQREEAPESRVERDAAEASSEEDYDTLKAPTRKSHGRMKRIARGKEKGYAHKTAGYSPH